MKYFGHYNENGEYTAFYNDDLHKLENIPTPYIELTEQQWSQAVSEKCRVVNGVHTYEGFSAQDLEQKNYLILRSERDSLLKESDWTQMPDSPLTEEQKQEWQVYRQALRDLPQTADINNIVYPTKPE